MLCETLLQQGTETRTRGRVFSARDFLMRLVFLIGVTAAGAISRAFGVQAALIACAATVGGTGVIALWWGRKLPPGPAVNPTAPAGGEPTLMATEGSALR
jgi:hypothetical protein